MQESDWDMFLERLVEQTKAAIEQFAAKHPGEAVCYFAYDSEPRYGYVLTCFDTPRHSLKSVREERDYVTQYRRKILDNPTFFDSAYHHATSPYLLPFCNNTGDFACQGFTEIEFPEWQTYAESPEYPTPQFFDDAYRTDHDYLINHVARLFCRATDRLVDQQAFARLRLARPTLIGFGFHDDDQFVINMLNLPDVA